MDSWSIFAQPCFEAWFHSFLDEKMSSEAKKMKVAGSQSTEKSASGRIENWPYPGIFFSSLVQIDHIFV